MNKKAIIKQLEKEYRKAIPQDLKDFVGLWEVMGYCNNCKKKNDNSEGDLVRNLSNIDCNPDNLEKLFGEDK